ncbi:3085_t:CDS:2, partial [Gigaspora margarita]
SILITSKGKILVWDAEDISVKESIKELESLFETEELEKPEALSFNKLLINLKHFVETL